MSPHLLLAETSGMNHTSDDLADSGAILQLIRRRRACARRQFLYVVLGLTKPAAKRDAPPGTF